MLSTGLTPDVIQQLQGSGISMKPAGRSTQIPQALLYWSSASLPEVHTTSATTNQQQTTQAHSSNNGLKLAIIHTELLSVLSPAIQLARMKTYSLRLGLRSHPACSARMFVLFRNPNA